VANFTQGETRVKLSLADLATFQASGSVVLDARRTRPFWFDGRFMAARDLAREQNYFLQRQADLGRAAGFGVIHGLWVDRPAAASKPKDAETIIIRAGQGITPAGELVMIPQDLTLRLSDLPEEQKLDLQFGLSRIPRPPARTRTGLYVVALRPVEFTANPIASYPTSLQGSRTTHDGDIVEATAVTLVPYPDPMTNFDPAHRRAAVARQIFLMGRPGQLSDAVLPIALLSVQRGTIDWLDPYLVRRDSGPEFSGVRLGLTDPATQQAFLLQYDAQLQEILSTRQLANLPNPSRFSASDYFQALPPAGRFPLGSISVDDFSQVFFPQQLDVRLSIIPQDELPSLIEESMSLPPIDLTLSADDYKNIAVFALIPVPRNGFAALKASLPDVPLRPTLPQVLGFRHPIELLRLYKGTVSITLPTPTVNNAWKRAIGQDVFGFYTRRKSMPTFADFATALPAPVPPTPAPTPTPLPTPTPIPPRPPNP